MDGEETNVAAGSPAALAKAALASVMSKPNGEVSSTTVAQLQAELVALKAKLAPQVVGPAAVKPDKVAAPPGKLAAKKAAKALKKQAKEDAKAAKFAAKAEKKAAKAEKKAAKDGKKAAAPQADKTTVMSASEAQAYVASFAGKKGRRPAAFHAAQKLAGVSAEPAVKAPKAPKASKTEKKAIVPTGTSMSVEEALAYVASFAGKRGRRSAAFYAAQKLAGVPVGSKAVKAEKPDKVAAKAAKLVAKAGKKAAKLVAKAEKKAAKLAAKAAKKAAPSTGQSGTPIKDLTIEDLNDKETVIMLALGTEGHRTEKSIKDLASECFPNKNKAQANSWTRNGMRRLVRAALLEKDARGVFKQSLEGRVVAKKLEVLKATKK